jgi:hypothetical protein
LFTPPSYLVLSFDFKSGFFPKSQTAVQNPYLDQPSRKEEVTKAAEVVAGEPVEEDAGSNLTKRGFP